MGQRQTGTATRAAIDILPREAASRLTAYKRDIQRVLPNVEKIILFGSRARNQARADSDYDVAVIVRDLSDRRHISRILSNLAYDHILSGFSSGRSRYRPIISNRAGGGQPNWPGTSSATALKSCEVRSRPGSGILAEGRSPPA